MIADPIDLNCLDDRSNYCVIRNAHNRESIVASGRRIKLLLSGEIRGTEFLSLADFQKFKPHESLTLVDYVRIRVDENLHLGVWLDPTRPELQTAGTERTSRPMAVPEVNAVVETRRSLVDELIVCSKSLLLLYNDGR